MLRMCVSRFCLSTTSNSGLASSSHSLGVSSLLQRLEPFVPTTFTALTQISRAVDAEVMEMVGEAGGLRSVLVNSPRLFTVGKVGNVYVARRLRSKVRDKSQHKEDSTGRRQVVKLSVGERCVKRTSHMHGAIPPEVVIKHFPTFFVPLDALVELEQNSLPSTDPMETKKIVEERLHKYVEFLDRVHIHGFTFVRLRESLAAAALKYEERQTEKDGEGSALLSERLAAYEVPSYEYFRVARLIPTVEQFVPITKEMELAALPLLSEGRLLLHVFVSAPHLFEVRDTPELSVRFLLNPSYRPIVSATREEIETMLKEIDSSNVRTGIRRPKDRKRRRSLRNQLQFLLNPCPYFDHEVLAHAFFDFLPTDTPAYVSLLLPILPKAALYCMPPNIQQFLNAYPHLFRLLPGEREVLVQRADLPLPEQRPLSSIDSEEILLSIFNAYSLRTHPSCGTCLTRCISRLPILIRARVVQMDFVEEVLRRHPEKVELLNKVDLKIATYTSPGSPECQLFRFIGEWQDELIKKHEAFCMKYGYDPENGLKNDD